MRPIKQTSMAQTPLMDIYSNCSCRRHLRWLQSKRLQRALEHKNWICMFRATSSMTLSHKRSPSVPRMWTGGRARFLEAALGIDIQRVDESAVSGALMI